MTDEQKAARKISAESGNIKWIKENCLRTKDGEDDYVFISYKSDDYKQVLDDIVYKTCKKYGLRVYFDTAFDDGSDSWIKQFYKNMCSNKCRAMIAFLDDKYFSSYATLIEMMARKTRKAGGDMKFDSLFFLPINIGDITDIYSDQNTGLGTERFANSKYNNQADMELSLFNQIFRELADSDRQLRYIYTHENDFNLYGEKTSDLPEYGEMYLSITECRAIMKLVCPKDNSNDGTNKDFVEVIRDKLMHAGLQSVFKNEGKVLEEGSEASEISSVTENKVETADIITGPAPLVSRKADFVSENRPEAIPDLVPRCMKKWTYRTKKGANAVLLWDGTSKHCKVLKGSIAAKEAPGFSNLPAKKLKDQLVSQGKLSGLTFIADCECDKISTMINLLNGGSINMQTEKGKNLVLAEDDADSAEWIPLEAGTDKQELQSPEPVPSAEPAESPSDECIYTYKNARIRCDINSKKCTVLKGSIADKEAPCFSNLPAKNLKEELKQKRIIENDVFLEDYTGRMAALLNLINGGSVSSTVAKKKFVREN